MKHDHKTHQDLIAEITEKADVKSATLPAGFAEREAVYKEALDNIISDLADYEASRTIWDCSKEKTQSIFAKDNMILLRPVNSGDAVFYVDVRMQYSMMYRSIVGTEPCRKESLFLMDLCKPESFYCVIESSEKHTPLGYIGIKDTSLEAWEIAIELDKRYTHQGRGPQSIRLFLKEIRRITGHTEFQALIDPDNYSSQKCFERLGAEVVGLHDSVFLRTSKDQERFEEEHLHLIDDRMIALAERINVEPRKLLSHVLDYRLTIS